MSNPPRIPGPLHSPGFRSLPQPAAGASPRQTQAPSRTPQAPPTVIDRLDNPGSAVIRPAAEVSDTRLRAPGEAGATARPRVAGHMQTPAISLNPEHMVSRFAEGALRVGVPLVEGARLGLVSVRPDTHARVHLAVVDGRLDRQHTRITFERSDGTPTSLDGPLWIDPESIYIDSNGAIRADVPCWPDPDLTEQLLGEGVRRVPDDPAEFVRLLRERSESGDIPVAPSVQLQGDGRITVAQQEPGSAAEAVEDDNSLIEALDLRNLEVQFEGTLRPGPLRFGNGTVVNLAPGSRVSARGTMDNMQAQVDARVRSFQMSAEGSRITSGSGRMLLDVQLENDDAGEEQSQTAVSLSVRQFDLERLRMEAPAGEQRHQLSIARLAVNGDDAGSPLLSFQHRAVGESRGEDRFVMRLPEVAMEGIEAHLHAQGSDGQPTTLTVGQGTHTAHLLTSGEVQPPEARRGAMNVRASVELDSARQAFTLEAELENLQAQLAPVQLAGSAHFDMDLAGARFGGSGRLSLTSDAAASEISLESSAEDPFTAEVELADARFGRGDGSGFVADLAAQSRGRMQLDALHLGTHRQPVFRGNGELDVRVDSLELPLADGQRVTIRPESSAQLTIHEMGWQEGDASPSLRATLRVDVGLDFAFDPSVMPGMEGVSAELQTETGRTFLVVETELLPDGTLQAAGDVNIRGARVRGERLVGNISQRPEVSVDSNPLPQARPLRMANLRRLSSPSQRRALPPTQPRTPTIPPIQIQPMSILSMLRETNASLAIPARPLHVDPFATYEGLAGTVRANVRLERPAGPILANFRVQDGRLVEGETTVILAPSIGIDIDITTGVGPVQGTSRVRAVVSGMRLRRNPDTGRGYFEPVVRWEGTLPSIARAIGLEDRVNREVGEYLSHAMTGHAEFPLSLADFTRTLSNHMGVLAVPIEPHLPGFVVASDSRPSPAPPAQSPTTPAAAQLLESIDLASAQLNIENTTIAPRRPTRLDLGDGQVLELLPGTSLTVRSTGGRLELSGHVVLGQTRLGGNDLGASLQGARADLQLTVQSSPSGGSAVTLELGSLEAQQLVATGTWAPASNAATHTQITTQAVRGATIRLRIDENAPMQLDVNIPNVQARLQATGDGSLGSQGEGTALLDGDVEGSLQIVNGAVSGTLRNIDLQAQGMFAQSSGATDAGGLRLQGSAVLQTSADGSLEISRQAQEGLRVDGNITLQDGTRARVSNATAERVRITPGRQGRVDIHDLQADIDAVLAVPTTPGGPVATLDLRRARVQGDVSFGPNGVSSENGFSLTGVDASLSNLPLELGDSFDIELSQLDIVGDYRVRMTAQGTFELTAVGPQRHPDGGLPARARAGRMRFEVEEPNIWMDMPNAEFELDLRRLAIGGSRVEMSLAGGRFDGVLRAGGVRIGREGSLVETIDLQPGTRVHGQVDALRMDHRPGITLDTTIRVEGDYSQGQTALNGADGDVVHEALTVNGNLRFALRAVAAGADNFGMGLEMDIDLDAHWAGRAQTNAGELLREHVPALPGQDD